MGTGWTGDTQEGLDWAGKASGLWEVGAFEGTTTLEEALVWAGSF